MNDTFDPEYERQVAPENEVGYKRDGKEREPDAEYAEGDVFVISAALDNGKYRQGKSRNEKEKGRDYVDADLDRKCTCLLLRCRHGCFFMISPCLYVKRESDHEANKCYPVSRYWVRSAGSTIFTRIVLEHGTESLHDEGSPQPARCCRPQSPAGLSPSGP